MVKIEGANIYVIFPSPSGRSPAILQKIISLPPEGEGGPVYKIVNEIAKHIEIDTPPVSSIRLEGLALRLHFRDISCQKLAIKPFKSNPLLKVTELEWEIAQAQAFLPHANGLTAKPLSIEEAVLSARSTIPRIICLDDYSFHQDFVQQKPLPRSAIFVAIVIFGLVCSLAVLAWRARNSGT
jgi:hypothetical protein